MTRPRRSASPRFRVGRMSVYPHHGNWWNYYRDGGQQVRRKVAPTREEAEQVAAQVNAQLTCGVPTLLAFTSIGVPELRQKFLDYHETPRSSRSRGRSARPRRPAPSHGGTRSPRCSRTPSSTR
jgi:hypothetical protein